MKCALPPPANDCFVRLDRRLRVVLAHCLGGVEIGQQRPTTSFSKRLFTVVQSGNTASELAPSDAFSRPAKMPDPMTHPSGVARKLPRAPTPKKVAL